MYLIGYDVGSSSIKAGLVETNTGKQVAVVSYPEREMDMLSRQSGWAEQQPENWWQNLVTATRKLLTETKVHPSDIKAIGISYQMHGLVLVDEHQRVLRPSIIWCDSRAVSIGDKAFEAMGPERCLSHLLNSPGNFTASKLKWVKDNEPYIYERIHKIMLPGDYIAMKLTGEVYTTVSGLSEGVFWDYSKKELSKGILNYYGFDEGLIPELKECTSNQGILTQEAADFTGLLPGIPVTYRSGDQPNNALSLNVLNPGEIAATSGTSGVVYGIVDKPVYDSQSRVNGFTHVNYEDRHDRIGILLCINGAGIQYSWLKHQIARSDRDYSDMERMASTVPIGSDGVCILPFGNGAERMFGNKNIGSHILGLEFNRHNRGHLYRAALEGIAFSFVYGVNILKEMGLEVDIMRVGNDNMFQSEVFSKTIATLLNCHIEVVDTTGAYGAARAAGVAVGAYKDISEALRSVEPSAVYEPDLHHSQCQLAYQHWVSCLDRILQKSRMAAGDTDLRLKNRDLISLIEEKNQELTASEMHVMAKDQLLNEAKSMLSSIMESGLPEDERRAVRRLVNKIDDSVDQEKQWKSFQEHFDFVHNDFFKKLKSIHPKITLPEARLCTLLKMNMTSKEIAEQLNLSVRGVETKRYRLRKRLDLSKNLSLEEFLERL